MTHISTQTPAVRPELASKIDSLAVDSYVSTFSKYTELVEEFLCDMEGLDLSDICTREIGEMIHTRMELFTADGQEHFNEVTTIIDLYDTLNQQILDQFTSWDIGLNTDEEIERCAMELTTACILLAQLDMRYNHATRDIPFGTPVDARSDPNGHWLQGFYMIAYIPEMKRFLVKGDLETHTMHKPLRLHQEVRLAKGTNL